MKLKRILAGVFASMLLLVPVSAVEQRLAVCVYCGKPTNWFVDCGGIDESQTEYLGCSDHGKNSDGTYKCFITREHGYTNHVCPNCGTTNIDRHLCHITHSINGKIEVVCQYGDYPN